MAGESRVGPAGGAAHEVEGGAQGDALPCRVATVDGNHAEAGREADLRERTEVRVDHGQGGAVVRPPGVSGHELLAPGRRRQDTDGPRGRDGEQILQRTLGPVVLDEQLEVWVDALGDHALEALP